MDQLRQSAEESSKLKTYYNSNGLGVLDEQACALLDQVRKECGDVLLDMRKALKNSEADPGVKSVALLLLSLEEDSHAA